MLKGISPILPPALLRILAEMGHGDSLVIGDGNFPAAGTAKRLVRCDGVGGAALLDAVLQLMPLDSHVPCPVGMMAVSPGDDIGEPAIWAQYREIIQKHEPVNNKMEMLERHAFYEKARGAYAIAATSEMALYANIILVKGVVNPD